MRISICFSFLLALFFSTPEMVQAQDRLLSKGDDGQYRYQAVHDCPEVTAEVLLKRMENWSKLKFGYYDVLEDAESLQVKGFILKRGIASGVNYSLVIEAKNNKYRTSVTDVQITVEDGSFYPIERTPVGKKMILNLVEKDLKTLLPNLDNFLKNKDQLNDDDW